MRTEPAKRVAGQTKPAIGEKKAFITRPLTRQERERMKIGQYYRPYRVKREVVLKERRFFWAFKRATDIVLASIALVILSPVLLISMLAIYMEDPHSSPIFSQQRVGRGGKTFRFHKLRSMYTGAEKMLDQLLEHNEFSGKAFKIKDDPRITKVGRFLRNTSIDELPQLVNIIKGDMSIVGPRPPLPREVEMYDDYEIQRLTVTPGLTCFWQTCPRRHEIDFDDWVALDIKYIVERSWLVDIKIILKTALLVLHGGTD